MSQAYDIEAVSAASAKDWLAGKFYVGDKLSAVSQIHFFPKEVVFVNHIGTDHVAGLKRIRDLGDIGCQWIVAHVADENMKKALLNRGMQVVATENIDYQGKTVPAYRMAGSPTVFAAWLKKLDAGIFTDV